MERNYVHGLNWECPLEELPPHARFIRGINWDATDLGPPRKWSSTLTLMVDLCLADPQAASVMWGDRLTMIYNESFVQFAGSKHPNLMGGTPVVEYAEVWDTMFAAIIKRGKENGQATRHKDVQLFLRRHGYLEEVFVTYTFVPIVGPDKSVVGFYHTAIETTSQVLAARRTQTLLEIGNQASSARNIDEYWINILAAFEPNPIDAPFVVAYEFSETLEDGSSQNSFGSGRRSSSTVSAPQSCCIVGAIRRAVVQLPTTFDVQDNYQTFRQQVKVATTTGQVLLLDRADGTFPDWLYEEVSEDIEKTCTRAVVVPIRPSPHEEDEAYRAIGFMIIGLNPHRNYDTDYERYIGLWTRQMGTSAASIVLMDQEVRRRRQLAVQLSLSAESQRQTENRFGRFAEMADVAMWIVDSEDQIVFANRAWHEQAQEYDTATTASAWMDAVADSCRPNVEKAWRRVLEERTHQVFEAQLKSTWVVKDRVNGEEVVRARWILCSAFPEAVNNDSLIGVWACSTDISHQKWAEALMEQRLSDVLEAKRQSETFIDMTSHEMRNPLSAIMQSADGILSSLSEMQVTPASGENQGQHAPTLDSMVEMAQTIIFCAQHQNRIVNDILTLSKLDASLLTVTPVPVDPVKTCVSALKLHEQELEKADIAGEIITDDSYHALDIDRVYLDPSRILQLLINLITNAIKFTRNSETRKITLRLTASSEIPSDMDTNGEYFANLKSKPALVLPRSDKKDRSVFLGFAVEDTGCGLSAEEKARLFMRFSQANHKTHIQYGGSGLGLFICKEIVELCGGRIGVISEPGKGSSFKFFLPVRLIPRDTTTEFELVQRQASVTSTGRMASPISRPPVPTNGLKVAASATTHFTLPYQIHILVVEDNLVNQKIMAQMLRKAGAVVHVANHGLDALNFMEKTTFSRNSGPDSTPLTLILLDSEMPVMDGLTCVEKIRQRQEGGEFVSTIPVIGVTANARPEQIQKAMRAGMDMVVSKPVRIPVLVKQIEETLQK